MKGLILINAYFNNEEYLYQAERMKEEFEKKNVVTTIERNNEFSFKIDNNNVCSKYGDYDFIVYWDKDKYILNMLHKIGANVFNSYQSIIDCDDKMTTYVALANNEIPLVKTVPGLFCYDKDEKIPLQAVQSLEAELNYPIIVKNSYGSLGKGVFMAKDRAELLCVMEQLKCFPHLFQQYVKTSYGKDLRIIVVGDEVVGGMIRKSNGDFRSNIGVGGSGEPYLPSDELKKLAIKIKNVLKLDYCGIDILFGENGPLVCEVNSNAFFYTFEKTTKINVAEKYADYIIKQTSLRNNLLSN